MQRPLLWRRIPHSDEIEPSVTLEFADGDRRWQIRPVGVSDFVGVSYQGDQKLYRITFNWAALLDRFPTQEKRFERFFGGFGAEGYWILGVKRGEVARAVGYDPADDRLIIVWAKKTSGGGHTWQKRYSWDECVCLFPQRAAMIRARYPNFGQQEFGAAQFAFPAAAAVLESAKPYAPPDTLVPDPGAQLYVINDNPWRMEAGFNVPGANPDREVIALRSDDMELVGFIAQVRALMTDRFGEGGSRPEQTLMQEVLAMSLAVRAAFTEQTEDTPAQWEIYQNRFTDKKITLGKFLAARSGCCRHIALAYQVVAQPKGVQSLAAPTDELAYGRLCRSKRGYAAFYRRGDFTFGDANVPALRQQGRHALEEIHLGDGRYYLDPLNQWFVERDLAESGVVLYWDSRVGHYINPRDGRFRPVVAAGHPPLFIQFTPGANPVEVPLAADGIGSGAANIVLRGGETI